ncbi:MAG: GHMP family kinase ATP-binding protein [Chloroflexota bacterium]
MPLIARAPMRISFGGGGTDLEAYYSRYGGMVVSAAVDKYFYTVVSESGSQSLQLISANYGTFHLQEAVQDLVWDGNLALPKAVVDHFGLPPGHDVFMASEIPPGTGLGSSSAAAVCLCLALAAKQERTVSRGELSELASYLEIERLGMPIGKQDQYASAFGGINAITFTKDGTIVEPLKLSPERTRELENHLMLFFMGSSRSSSTILRQQMESTRRGERVVLESLHAIKEMAVQMRVEMEEGDLSAVGRMLDQGWEMKKRLASTVTNESIDGSYRTAREAGALGGKVTGAGGGGFLLLYCPPESQPDVVRRLGERGLHQIRFQFDFLGAHILMNSAELLQEQGLEEGSGLWVLERARRAKRSRAA